MLTATCKQVNQHVLDMLANKRICLRLLVCGGEVLAAKLASWCACYWAVNAAMPSTPAPSLAA